MIKMQKNMLYSRYIVFFDGQQEILAIDTDYNHNSSSGYYPESALYLWTMQDRQAKYDYVTQVKIIGVDTV